MNKQEFLESISEGKWFSISGKYGGKYAVKMVKNKRYDGEIHALWLSFNDPESMCIEDYSNKDWNYSDGKLETLAAGVYHFGSAEVAEDSIYDDEYKIVEEKMFDVILKNTLEYLVTKEEIEKVWEQLKSDELNLPVLQM
ncbi:hypothetical protein ACFQZE_07115 [Paenibacillus sp. GCM10027627]|uniref:hypothetical protein n=1 Tax=unclassified Paenibacillus TaxID=185978 RepID=UPI0036283A9B